MLPPGLESPTLRALMTSDHFSEDYKPLAVMMVVISVSSVAAEQRFSLKN